METRHLYRSRSDRMIAGVCAGIAAYFGVDTTLVRLLFVVLAIPGVFPAVLLYLVLWAIVPPSPVGV